MVKGLIIFSAFPECNEISLHNEIQSFQSRKFV